MGLSRTRFSERRRSTWHSLSRSLFFLGLFIILAEVHGQMSPSASPTENPASPTIDPETIDPKTDLWEAAFHGATIMGNFWRIQNGYAGYYNGTDKMPGTNVHLREIDLTNPFALGSIDEAPLEVRDIPENIGSLWVGANWGSNNKLFAIGGQTPSWDSAVNWPGFHEPANPYEIARYDTDQDKWDNIYPNDQEGQRILRAAGIFTVEVPETGKAYMLGGHINEIPIDPPQLTVVDFNENPDNPSWSRWTISTSLRRFRTFGSMVRVPFGDKGLLVLLGGADGHGSNSNGPADGPRDGETIDIYNLDAPSGRDSEPGSLMRPVKAYEDPGRGIPDIRKHPCSFVGIAPDNSSAQIFFYGGGLENADPYIATGELWVLSLPSFDWIFLEDYRGKGTQTNPGPKEGMTCNMFGRNYMMMYGGRNPPEFSKNSETTGMYAMDMSKVEWIEDWPGSREAKAKKYTVPKKVVKVIGGTENGGSTKKWKDDAKMDGKLVEFFDAHFAKVKPDMSEQPGSLGPGTPKSDAPESGAPESDASESDEKKSTSLSPGTIAGIGVGVVVGLTLIALGAFFLIRRRRTAEPDVYQKPELPDNSVNAVARSPIYNHNSSVAGYHHSDMGQWVHEAPSGQETATAAELPGSSADKGEHDVPARS